MEFNKNTTEYLKKLGQVKLSEASRARVAKNLEEYADFHTVSEDVRVEKHDRSIERVSQTSVWYTVFFIRSKRLTMPMLAIAAILLVGGGTSFAAQGSVPGDMLYPIKVGVNENVRSALAVTAESEARLQAQLLTERVREAEELRGEGRLEGELAAAVRTNVAAQAETADAAGDQTAADVAVETDNAVLLSLTRFNSLIDADQRIDVSTRLATRSGSTGNARQSADVANSVAMSESTDDTDMAMSATMAMKPVDGATLSANLTTRLEALFAVLGRYKAEIQTEVYAEFEAALVEARELIAVAKTQTEAEARANFSAAADLVGQVEASLSSLGQVKIDPETGAIIDLDLNAVTHIDEPVLDLMPTPIPTRIDTQGNSSVNFDGGGDSGFDPSEDIEEGFRNDLESSVQSTTGLSF